MSVGAHVCATLLCDWPGCTRQWSGRLVNDAEIDYRAAKAAGWRSVVGGAPGRPYGPAAEPIDLCPLHVKTRHAQKRLAARATKAGMGITQPTTEKFRQYF